MKIHSLHVGGGACNLGCLSRAEAALKLILHCVPQHVPNRAGGAHQRPCAFSKCIHLSQSMHASVLTQSSKTNVKAAKQDSSSRWAAGFRRA